MASTVEQVGPFMRDFSADHDWLSINTATIRKQLGADFQPSIWATSDSDRKQP